MGDELEPNETTPASPAAPAAPAAPPVVVLSAEAARNTPEYRALEEAHRRMGAERARVEAELAQSRTAAEEARQAAEAQRVADFERQLTERLGEAGTAAYQEIAALSQSDPMAAAMRVAELVSQAQGQTPPAAAAAPASPTEGAPAVANAAPPPPSSGVEGGAPLGQATTGEDVDQIISDLSKTYAEVVERNQNLGSRNRVTMRDRAKGMISFLGASYLKAGAKPKTG